MNGPIDPILSQMCGSDERSFERGLRALVKRWGGVESAPRLSELIVALKGFGEARAIGPTEASRRVRITVEAARLPDRQLRELACSLSHLAPALRQAVIAFLPASLRRLAYSPQGPPPPAGESPAPAHREGGLGPPNDPDARSAPERSRECASVVLLGTYADHEENRQALEKRGFAAPRAKTVAELDEYLDHDVCGVVVARSWWAGIPEPERLGVLRRIIQHSSFAWLKLDTHSLPCVGEQFRQLLLSVRYSGPEWDDCVCQDGWRLTPHDLDALERVRGVLANSEAVRLCPAEIQEPQARVLIGAAIKHVRRRNFAGPFRLTRVEANFIPGGRSFARIIRMAPDDDGAPLVAKVDEAGRLSDEMNRFKRYAQKWDSALNPQLHYHSGTSLIIFGLVESPESPGRPAPTLEETLEGVFYCEHWPDSYQGTPEDDLRELINRAIRKLKLLHSQAADRSCKGKGYVACEPYQTLRQIGMTWDVRNFDGSEGNVFDFAYHARGRVAALGDKVIIHGDVQLRNVLVRDGREPYFIDYANCGPGHPCFDLIRLESAIFFYCFRMNGDERAIAALCLDVLRGRDEAAIREDHPGLCSSRTNRLAIHASVSCRAAALEVLAGVGGTEDDYLAMKFVLACQSLFMIHLQAGVVRGQMSALGAYLNARPAWRKASRAEQTP